MAAGMTKSQVVRYLAEKTSLSNKDTAAFLEQVVDLAVKEAKKNGLFVLPGLGRLKKVHRKARMGRNPQTGERSSTLPSPRRMPSHRKSSFRFSENREGRLIPALFVSKLEVCGEPQRRPSRPQVCPEFAAKKIRNRNSSGK